MFFSKNSMGTALHYGNGCNIGQEAYRCELHFVQNEKDSDLVTCLECSLHAYLPGGWQRWADQGSWRARLRMRPVSASACHLPPPKSGTSSPEKKT